MLFSLALVAGPTGPSMERPYNPVVTIQVTRPDGQTTQLSVPESGLGTVTLADGTAIGFRPTIKDAKPWTDVVVTVFALPTVKHGSETLGEVELKAHGQTVHTKTTPAFKIAVTDVTRAAGWVKR
jgi:hypothetical protein